MSERSRASSCGLTLKLGHLEGVSFPNRRLFRRQIHDRIARSTAWPIGTILRGDGDPQERNVLRTAITFAVRVRDHPEGCPDTDRFLVWVLPDDDELRVARPVAVVLLATVPRSDSWSGY